jgi:hypothetical protein
MHGVVGNGVTKHSLEYRRSDALFMKDMKIETPFYHSKCIVKCKNEM